MPNSEERRTDERIKHKAAKLKIVFTSDTPGLLGKVLTGSTVDISASGLQITLGTAIPVDSTIDVSVTLDSGPKEYFLSGKVRWCKESTESEGYNVGIALQDLINTETDFIQWRQALKN